MPKATPQQCEWPCSLCSAVFVASNKAQLTKKRDNHIVRKHAQVDRSLFTTLRGTMGASHKSKPGKGCRRDRQGRWMWTCNVCSDTSKHASKASLRSLRAHHIKTVHPTVCGSSFTTINGNPGRRTRFDHGELRQILMHTPSRRKLLEDPLPRFELVQTDVAPTLSAMATLRPIPARRLRHKPLGFLLAMPMAMLTATMHWTSRRPSVLTHLPAGGECQLHFGRPASQPVSSLGLPCLGGAGATDGQRLLRRCSPGCSPGCAGALRSERCQRLLRGHVYRCGELLLDHCVATTPQGQRRQL